MPTYPIVRYPPVATGGGGSAIPNASWSQAAWFIDPANSSGLAHDSNNGLTATTPLVTFGELLRRWATPNPILYQDTTITFMSDQADNSDPVVITPTVTPASGFGILTIQGTPTQIGSGTFSAVVVKNRSTGQRWTATAQGAPAGYWAPFVGMLLHDTTANCWFWIDDDLGAATAQLTEPLAAADINTVNPAMTPIAALDAFIIYQPTKVYCPIFQPIDAVGTTALARHLWFFSVPGPFGFTNQLVAGSVFFIESRLDGFVVGGAGTVGDVIATNCAIRGGMTLQQGTIVGGSVHKAGGFSLLAVSAGAAVLLDGDVVIGDFLSNNGVIDIGFVFLQPTVDVPAQQNQGFGVLAFSSNAAYYGVGLWGPGGINIHAGGMLSVQGVTFVAALMNSGALTMDGVAVANAIDSSVNPGVINTGRALTPALLDTPIGGGGFGGYAQGVLGSKITTFA